MILYNTITKRTMEGTPALLKLLENKGWIDSAELTKEETKFPFELIQDEDLGKPDKFIEEEESIIQPIHNSVDELNADLSTDKEKETPKAKAVKPKQNKNKK